MLINVEMNCLTKKLSNLLTKGEQINQINIWLENNNITESEHVTLMKYVGVDI